MALGRSHYVGGVLLLQRKLGRELTDSFVEQQRIRGLHMSSPHKSLRHSQRAIIRICAEVAVYKSQKSGRGEGGTRAKVLQTSHLLRSKLQCTL